MINFIKSLLRKQKVKVPDLETEISYDQKRAVIESYWTKFSPKIFIETGTFLGDTTDYFKEKFDKLYSIELSSELASRATLRFESDANVEIIQGDSADKLEGLIDKIPGAALFWLDGHYSSEFFYKGEYLITAKADKNTPVEKELDIILDSDLAHIILIDDARLFTGEHDYPTIQKIIEKIKLKKPGYSILVDTDIIQIFPS